MHSVKCNCAVEEMLHPGMLITNKKNVKKNVLANDRVASTFCFEQFGCVEVRAAPCHLLAQVCGLACAIEA